MKKTKLQLLDDNRILTNQIHRQLGVIAKQKISLQNYKFMKAVQERKIKNIIRQLQTILDHPYSRKSISIRKVT